MKKQHVLVLMGGKSTEREVSLRSGKAVSAALRQAGFSVTELDPALGSLSEIEKAAPDCVFIALHGIGGEDGAIQGLLEWLNLPYTGPGIAASALCMDKIMTKKVLALSGVPTPEFAMIDPAKPSAEKELSAAASRLGLPLVLKSCRQGSSIGTVIVREEKELLPALRSLLPFGDPVLAEAFCSGTELTVPIMGNESLTVLPIIEILSEGEYYDYHSKYTPGQSHHVIPARISPELNEGVRTLAERAYLATGCRGYTRVDVMLDEAENPYVIEINTAPGMTETSLFPDAAEKAGMDFPALVSKLVALAMEENPSP